MSKNLKRFLNFYYRSGVEHAADIQVRGTIMQADSAVTYFVTCCFLNKNLEGLPPLLIFSNSQ